MKLSQAEVQRAEELIDHHIDEAHRDGAYVRVVERMGPVAIIAVNGIECLVDPLGVIEMLQRMQGEPTSKPRPKLEIVR